MSAREIRLGDRVTIGKGRTRYTVTAIIRYSCAFVESAYTPGESLPSAKLVRAVLVRNRRTYWAGKKRGRGITVDVERLQRVKR